MVLGGANGWRRADRAAADAACPGLLPLVGPPRGDRVDLGGVILADQQLAITTGRFSQLGSAPAVLQGGDVGSAPRRRGDILAPMWPLLIAVALAPFVALVVWWLTRADRLDADALRRIAGERGWVATPFDDDDREGVVLAPPDAAWRVTVTRRKPRSRGHQTRSGGLQTAWSAPAPTVNGLLAVRPGRRPEGPLAPPPALLQGLLTRALEELGAPGPIGSLAPVDTGDAAFDGAHVAVTDDATLGARLADARTRALYARAAALGATVVLSRAGLQVSMTGQRDAATLDRLVAAGRALQTV